MNILIIILILPLHSKQNYRFLRISDIYMNSMEKAGYTPAFSYMYVLSAD